MTALIAVKNIETINNNVFLLIENFSLLFSEDAKSDEINIRINPNNLFKVIDSFKKSNDRVKTNTGTN